MKVFSYDTPLIRFSNDERDYWTVDDALKGVSIIGGTGSGKTTASGQKLAKEYLRQGWGGIVLCAKTDEAALWKQYCIETNRENDLIMFQKGAKYDADKYKNDPEISKYINQEIVFNALEYEMNREGEGAGEAHNITNIFMNIYRMGNRIANEGDTKEERFWDTALKRCLNRTIDLINLADEDLTYSNMVKLISSSANLDEDSYYEKEQLLQKSKKIFDIDKPDNYCFKCLYNSNIAIHKGEKRSNEAANSFTLAYDYFLITMPNMGEKTRSIITEMYMGLAEPFLSGLLNKHFAGKANILPEWTYEKNKIIVLNFPIKEYLDIGIIAQCVFKLLFQQAIERRDINKFPTPVFLWADEAQYFVNSYDQIFLTTARGSRAATVFLSQNIPNYMAVMGSGNDAQARVDSLMGNLSTKIFHANSDATTNQYASGLIGNAIQFTPSNQNSQNLFQLNFQNALTLAGNYLPQIQPKDFTMLRNGGKKNNFEVDAIIFTTGKTWSSGTNYLESFFLQDLKY